MTAVSTPKASRAEAKILVLMLHSGENEYGDSRRALDRQTHANWELKVISGLPEKEAHLALYEEIMRRGDSFDIYVKLDADMVLNDDDALARIAQFYAAHPDADQVNFVLHDILTDSDILGLITFTGRARWDLGSTEPLFVDEAPAIPGRCLTVWDPDPPIAVHCPYPHAFQAFHFGAHRMMKALQRRRRPKRWIQSALQWRLLGKVWRLSGREGDARRDYMMLGACAVWRGELGADATNYRSASLAAAFELYSARLARDDLVRILGAWWRVSIRLHQLPYWLLSPRFLAHRAYWKYRVRGTNPRSAQDERGEDRPAGAR
jgi:hypothetical protein